MKTNLLLVVFTLVSAFSFAQCVSPADPTATTLQVPCGSNANFSPIGGGNYFWYNNATADSMIAIASNYTVPSLFADTTLGVQEYSLGPATAIPMPTQTGTLTGNVRGFYFTAPVRAMLTGADIPTEASTGNQSIAIVKFNTLPPLFSTTTNDFTVLFMVQDGSSSGVFPMNILIEPGDIIGVLGQRSTVNSYGPSNYATTMIGVPVTVARLGMQFPLTTTAPQQLWTESGGSISRVNLYFNEVCTSDTVAYTAEVIGLDVDLTANTTSVCDSGSVQFDVTGATDYTWSTGSTNTTETYLIDSTTTIIVNGTDAMGCAGADTITVIANPSPIVGLGADIAECGSSTDLDGGLSSMNYSWSNGDTTQIITVFSSGSYNVTVTDSLGCFGSDTIVVQLNPNPVVALNGPSLICEGSSDTLVASGTTNYLWDDGSMNDFLVVTPTTDSSFTVLGTDVYGCSDTATIFVMLSPLPTVTAQSATSFICEYAGPVALTGSPAGGTWSGNGVTGSTFDPTGNDGMNNLTYSFTDGNGCSNSDVTTVEVDSCLAIGDNVAFSFGVFPNPSAGVINVSTEQTTQNVVIELLDIQGRLVKTQIVQEMAAGSTTVLNLQQFESGNYTLRITSSGIITVRKIVLQN